MRRGCEKRAKAGAARPISARLRISGDMALYGVRRVLPSLRTILCVPYARVMAWQSSQPLSITYARTVAICGCFGTRATGSRYASLVMTERRCSMMAVLDDDRGPERHAWPSGPLRRLCYGNRRNVMNIYAALAIVMNFYWNVNQSGVLVNLRLTNSGTAAFMLVFFFTDFAKLHTA